MKQQFSLVIRLGILFLFLVSVFASCVPIKRIKYLQQEVEKDDTLKSDFSNKSGPDYKIQARDNLYIKVYSPIAKTENFFQEDISASSNYYNDQGIFLNSYLVTDLGYIDFPFVGEVYVMGLNYDQAKNLIKGIVDDYLKGATVIVRLAAFKVTMLGEVARPGEFSIWESKFNIFDAISQAGDLTPKAKRNDIVIVRETKNGSVVKHLDLNDIMILESDYYFLLPGDIVYVPPLKGKNFIFAEFPYALFFSTITTTLLLINFFKTN
jgi:polysaccharide export outer membrane protein